MWTEKTIPTVWKFGLTVLAHKKGDTKNLDNFRPITLQPVMLKVLTSCIRDRIYSYCVENSYIDTKTQKGFWEGISGTIENNEALTYAINQARLRQKSLVITLIDLKNAFGEVNHNLIRSVLQFHHLPPEIAYIIMEIYNDFRIPIASDNYITSPIPVKRGVLQGDSLSPLLFNLCSPMLTVNQEKLKCMRYIFGNTLSPKNWMQFADDTAVITALKSDNQLLLNLFTKWCVWADFVIKVEKCHTFGIKKYKTSSIQYQPYLMAINKIIPAIETGKSFRYLGKDFSFSMDNTPAKAEILQHLETHLTLTDRLPLHQRYKLKVIQQFTYSKIRWLLSINKFDVTWIKQSCDNLVTRFLRKWLNMHPGANISHMSLSHKRIGLNFSLPSHIYTYAKISTRSLMKTSADIDIRSLYVETQEKNIAYDSVIEKTVTNKNQLAKKAVSTSKKEIECKTWDVFIKLSKFLRRAILLSLPTKKNLKTWNLIQDNICPLCKAKPQTQHHLLNNCNVAANEHRYLWRHNSVLNCIIYHLASITNTTRKIFVDLPGFENIDQLFENGHRPDLVIVTPEKTVAVELTICFETNLIKSKHFKKNKYSDLQSSLKSRVKKFELVCLQISSLGFFSDDISPFKHLVKRFGLDDKVLIDKMRETAIGASYYICNRRDKSWTLPDLLLFS